MTMISRAWKYYNGAHIYQHKNNAEINTFINEVLADNRHFYIFDRIEYARELYLKSNEIIDWQEMGAGSKKLGNDTRKVAQIAKTSLSPERTCHMLYHAVRHYKHSNVLELGSSLGISTAYLAAAHPDVQLVSMEGNPTCAEYTRKLLDELDLHKAKVITGNFDNKLKTTLQSMGSIDLAYMDGNHSYDATMRYFQQILPYTHNKSVLVLDDIYWSDGMLQAWEEIKNQSQVTYSVDVYNLGFVFFDTTFKSKKHWKLLPYWMKPWQAIAYK